MDSHYSLYGDWIPVNLGRRGHCQDVEAASDAATGDNKHYISILVKILHYNNFQGTTILVEAVPFQTEPV